MISSLLEGICEFFFLYSQISNQFLHDKWNLAKKKMLKYFQCPFQDLSGVYMICHSAHGLPYWDLLREMICMFNHTYLWGIMKMHVDSNGSIWLHNCMCIVIYRKQVTIWTFHFTSSINSINTVSKCEIEAKLQNQAKPEWSGWIFLSKEYNCNNKMHRESVKIGESANLIEESWRQRISLIPRQ